MAGTSAARYHELCAFLPRRGRGCGVRAAGANGLEMSGDSERLREYGRATGAASCLFLHIFIILLFCDEHLDTPTWKPLDVMPSYTCLLPDCFADD